MLLPYIYDMILICTMRYDVLYRALRSQFTMRRCMIWNFIMLKNMQDMIFYEKRTLLPSCACNPHSADRLIVSDRLIVPYRLLRCDRRMVCYRHMMCDLHFEVRSTYEECTTYDM